MMSILTDDGTSTQNAKQAAAQTTYRLQVAWISLEFESFTLPVKNKHTHTLHTTVQVGACTGEWLRHMKEILR